MTFRVPEYTSNVSPSSFNNVVEVYGTNYILVKADTHFRCPRYNAATGDCDPPICDVCHGQKYIHTYEIHTMYKSLNREPSYGSPELVPFLFFCKSTSGIKDKDRIIEVIWGANGAVEEVIAEYEIKATHDYLLSGQRVYSIAASSKVKLTTDRKTLRYLQDIYRIGVTGDPND